MCNELGVAPPVQMPLSMNVEAREIEDGHLLTISSNSVYPGKTWYYPDMPTLLMNVTARMLEEWGAAKRGPEVKPDSSFKGDDAMSAKDMEEYDREQEQKARAFEREKGLRFGGEATYFKGDPEAFRASVAQGQRNAYSEPQPQYGGEVYKKVQDLQGVTEQQRTWTSGDQAQGTAPRGGIQQPSTLDYRSKEQKAVDQALSKQQRVAWQAEIDSKVEVYRDRLERQYGLDDD